MIVMIFPFSRTPPPRAMYSYDCTLPPQRWAWRALMAAVSVVLPWSMWPIVPTLTCGFVRVRGSLAMSPPKRVLRGGANRAGKRRIGGGLGAILNGGVTLGAANKFEVVRW